MISIVKTTKDWLLTAPILNTAGTGAPYINGGDVKNTGVELALTWDDTLGKDFKYNNLTERSYNKNEVGNNSYQRWYHPWCRR